MDAKEFMEERNRMLNSLGRINSRCYGVPCNKCYLYNPGADSDCLYNTEKAIDIVEKWSKEHPKRTYLDVLLEAFPDTPMTNGVPTSVCPCDIGLTENSCTQISMGCRDCWNKEYEV